MLKIEEDKACFQCEKVKKTVSFTEDNGIDLNICEDCISNYVNDKIVFE